MSGRPIKRTLRDEPLLVGQDEMGWHHSGLR